LFAQINVPKAKGTLHGVDASHRFLALLASQGATGNSLRSNIRLLHLCLSVCLSALLSAAPRGSIQTGLQNL